MTIKIENLSQLILFCKIKYLQTKLKECFRVQMSHCHLYNACSPFLFNFLLPKHTNYCCKDAIVTLRCLPHFHESPFTTVKK